MSCCYKLFAAVIVILAIVLGSLGVSLSMNHLSAVMVITNFFDIMLPILAVGALVKYLLGRSKSGCGVDCCKPACCDVSECAPTACSTQKSEPTSGCCRHE
jgi:hypothetical protein